MDLKNINKALQIITTERNIQREIITKKIDHLKKEKQWESVRHNICHLESKIDSIDSFVILLIQSFKKEEMKLKTCLKCNGLYYEHCMTCMGNKCAEVNKLNKKLLKELENKK